MKSGWMLESFGSAFSQRMGSLFTPRMPTSVGTFSPVSYDNSYMPRETKFGKTNVAAANPNGADCWRLGISLQPELVVGKLTCGFHLGMYLLDNVKSLEPGTADDQAKYLTEEQRAEYAATGRVTKGIVYAYDLGNAGQGGHPDGWLYTQLVLRYHLPYHIFIQGNMKSHLSKVEFICLGLGAYF